MERTCKIPVSDKIKPLLKESIDIPGAKAGDDIVITKHIGLLGTSLLCDFCKDSLSERFPARFIEKALSYSKDTSFDTDIDIAKKYNASAIKTMSLGGIIAGLWDFGYSNKVGFTVDMRLIPVRQETIEICEEFDINPYELISEGCVIVALHNSRDFIKACLDAGINATCIGSVTSDIDRIICNGDSKAHIRPIKRDEISKIII